MKISHLLLLPLLTSVIVRAGYFQSFIQIKEQVLTPQSAAVVAGGLGIFGFGYYAYDLCKVSHALWNGDDGVTELRINDIKNLSYCPFKEKYNYGLIELLSHKPIYLTYGIERKESKFAKMAYSLGCMDICYGIDLEEKKFDLQWIENEYNQIFIPTRLKAINDAKREFKWRAFYDVSAITAISVVGYGAYTLINK